MNIAFFCHYLGGYGANRSLINMMSGLRNAGHTPFVICPGDSGITEIFDEMKIPYASFLFNWGHNKTPRNDDEIIHRLKYQLQIAGPIINQLLDWNIDLIYSNSSVIDIGFMIARMMGKPHVWHIREYGALDYELIPDLGEFSYRRLLEKSDGIVFISKALQNHFLGDADHKGTVVYNGVVTENEARELQVTRESMGERERFTFAFVGTMMPSKGQDCALYALKILVENGIDAQIVFAGGGQTSYIKNLCTDLGLDEHVTLLGHSKNPFDVYLNADASLMCSKNEAMGRVTVEAMASGIPVIGNNSGGTPELIRHGFNGLLYEGTPENLAEKMAILITNRSLAKELGRNASDYFLNNFTEEIYAAGIDSYITEVAANYRWEEKLFNFENPESRIPMIYSVLLNTKYDA